MQGDSAGIYQYQPLWGSWQVDGLIGSGKFGNVYRISHEEFGQKYTSAVKMISIPNADQFKEAASSIGNHEATLRNYFHEMVQSLVNEVNILYSLSGNSNILGYHDHKIIEHKDKVGWDISMRGTPHYMAPEVFHGEKYGAAVDIYSLGIVMCKLVNHGRLPIVPPYPETVSARYSEDALEKRMRGERFPAPDQAGDALAKVVMKACAFNAADRYPSPLKMKRDLQRVLHGLSDIKGGECVTMLDIGAALSAEKPETTAIG